jgi:capsule biosynthesis phosphatase
MLCWVLDNLQLGPNDEVVIVYDPAFLLPKYWPLILDKYPKLRRVELAGPTRGAAETVLLGLKGLPPKDRKRPVMLCDGDTFYTADVVTKYRAAAALRQNAVFFFDSFDPKPIYSYVTIEPSTGLVQDVREKVKISDHANSGCYCFADGARLAAECEAMLAEGQTQLSQDKVGEYYTSGVIKRMLEAKAGREPFAALRLHEHDFHVLGTPAQVQAFCAAHPDVPKLRFCFDLDNTLVTAPQVPGDYTTCLPIPENIEMAQALHQQGHYIIVNTARRMRTHKGNPNAVIADIGLLTLEQLKKYAIPHDEVSFGKPWAQFYIDDLAVDALGDVAKQCGFYFPSTAKAGHKAHISGTTSTSSIVPEQRVALLPLAASFLVGAAVALATVVVIGARTAVANPRK